MWRLLKKKTVPELIGLLYKKIEDSVDCVSKTKTIINLKTELEERDKEIKLLEQYFKTKVKEKLKNEQIF